jgi:hypothetical protein
MLGDSCHYLSLHFEISIKSTLFYAHHGLLEEKMATHRNGYMSQKPISAKKAQNKAKCQFLNIKYS